MTPSLILQALPCQSGQPLLGFTVSRKVGNAVERNRARRRLKEAARQLAPGLARADHHYVIVGRRATLGASYGSILEDLERAFKRAHKRTVATDRNSADG